ncbi:MAG: DUF2599 domain-containing protein [Erysipelotrichaceae bacterium]|nr:DUF2599 domain-containing protein [Erysipelotrichaceae bacterium]
MKTIKIILVTMLLMCSFVTSVSADENDYEINGYIVRMNGVSYDLSTQEGNYNLVADNKSMTTEEYIRILNMVYNETLIPIQDNIGGNGTNEYVPDDPGITGGYTYFYSMTWIYRSDDGWNLSLNPKPDTRSTVIDNLNGWSEVVSNQSSNSHWYNAESLKGQYICHFWFASSKQFWHIAPSIPNKSAFQWVEDKCN